MAGWIHLHPVSESELGMGWETARAGSPGTVAYILPGSRLVRRMMERYGDAGVKFMTFDQFVRWCLGSACQRPLMTRAQQRILIEQALWELEEEHGPLAFLDKAVQRPSRWAGALEGALGELKRTGVTPDRLRELWRSRSAKYRELAKFYEVYQNLLHRHGFWDQEEPYFELSRLWRDERTRRPGRVVLEHFHDLNPLQEQLLTALVTGTDIHFHVMYDERRELLRSMAEPIVRRLQARGFQTVAVSRNPGREFGRHASLIHLCEEAFSEHPAAREASGALQVIKAPGMGAEADAVVARLKRWLQETGADCSDAAVIVPSLHTYGPPLFKRLDRAGIPVRTGSSVSLAFHPMFQAVLAAFQVRFEQEDALGVLVRSSHFTWSGRAEKLRELFSRRDAPKTPAELRRAWQDAMENLEAGKDDPDSAVRGDTEEKLRQWREAGLAVEALCSWIEAIPESMEWSEWIHWFEGWIQPLQNRERWRQLAASPLLLKEAAEEIAVWNELQDLAGRWKQMIRPGTSRVLDGMRFAALLADIAKECMVPVRRSGRRGIQILEAPDVRGDRFRAVFMMGCADGIWPRAHVDFWLLPDKERLNLRNEEVRLILSGEHRARERVEFFMSLASAGELLVISCPTMDKDGKKLIPSPYLEEVMQVLSGVPERRIDMSEQAGPVAWEAACSPEQAAEYALSRLANSDVKPDELARAAAVAEIWQKERPERWRLLLDRAAAQRSRSSPGWTPFDGMVRLEGSPGERLASRLFMRDWRSDDLDALISCRFLFLSEKIWRVQGEDSRPEAGTSVRGGWLHRVMSAFWNAYRENPGHWITGEQSWIRLSRKAGEQVEEWLRFEGRGENRLRVMVEYRRFLNELRKFWNEERKWREETKWYEPPLVDVNYLLELPLPGEGDRVLRLSGKIDRVDVFPDGRYAVFDYKIRDSATKDEIVKGRRAGLYVALWAYQQLEGADPDQAAGAAYWLPKGRTTGLWHKDRVGSLKIRPRNPLSDEDWEACQARVKEEVARQLELALAGDFRVQPAHGCPEFCPGRKICRVDLRRLPIPQESSGKEGS